MRPPQKISSSFPNSAQDDLTFPPSFCSACQRKLVQIEKFEVIKQLAIFNGSICADFDGDEHDRDVIRKKQQ